MVAEDRPRSETGSGFRFGAGRRIRCGRMEVSRSRAERGRSAGRLTAIVLLLGLAGAVLLVATEFSTVVTVELDTGTCEEFADPEARDDCDKRGLEQHGGALLLLALLALAMTLGAARGKSRPAAAGLVLVASVVVGLALLRDLPASNKAGFVTFAYEAGEASASPGPGFYFEIAGAALCAVAGGLRLIRR